MISDIKNQDEFVAFREAINKLKELNQPLLLKLVNSLYEKTKDYLKEIMKTQRVAITQNAGNTMTEARKVVKTVGRKIANVPQPNEPS